MLSGCGADDRAAFVDSRPPPDLAERFYPPENWAWGQFQVGDGPTQRYGVSAPATASDGDVLILPDYGESAETWFETARDLNDAGWTVWVLEGVGAGGSSRLSGHRDLGHVKSFDADLAGVRGMMDDVVRPIPQRPLVLLGQGVGGLLAARTVETGSRVSGLVISSPRCEGAVAAGTLVSLGLGEFRAPGRDNWSRQGPDDFAAHRTHDRWRGAVTHAWQLANPDLRLGGPSLDWEAALAALQRQSGGAASGLTGPTLVIDDGRARACIAPPVAVRRSLGGADPALELEADHWRRPWLEAIQALLATAAHPPAHAS
ncbi:MAG TPA: alpha/beta fold hydrolase [Caulobacteraceae bacterium]|nr:alpha/beta fold hydrolase [Caulobacteraceae bacterium]